MSALVCLALYVSGTVGFTSVECQRVSLLERAEMVVKCDKSSNCRWSWVDDELWIHILVNPPTSKSKKDKGV